MLSLTSPRHTSTLRIPAGWSRREGALRIAAVDVAVGRIPAVPFQLRNDRFGTPNRRPSSDTIWITSNQLLSQRRRWI
jgi:hypothetical protein